MEYLRAVLSVIYFGVELYAVNFLFFVGERRVRAVAAFRNLFKARGELGYPVRMAHPAYRFFGNVLGELGRVAGYFRLAVFRSGRALHRAAR